MVSETSATGGMHILIAEDDPSQRAILTLTLSGWGNRVTTVADGKGAVDAAVSGSFDAVILDNRLPGLSGPEVARRVRAALSADALPLMLAMTADVNPEYHREFEDAGVDVVLVKPVNWEHLRKLLEDRHKARG